MEGADHHQVRGCWWVGRSMCRNLFLMSAYKKVGTVSRSGNLASLIFYSSDKVNGSRIH